MEKFILKLIIYRMSLREDPLHRPKEAIKCQAGKCKILTSSVWKMHSCPV